MTITRHNVAARHINPGDYLDTHYVARVIEVLEIPDTDPDADRVRITHRDIHTGHDFTQTVHHDDTVTVRRISTDV